MIKFLHAADLHLGSAFASLPPTVANQRRAELLETANEIIELCNSNHCQLLLLAGDLCETPDSARALARLLATCTAEVVIAPGNHDPYRAKGPYANISWPDNVSIFTESEMVRLQFEDLECDVYGAAFVSDTAPDLMKDFQVLDPDVVNLMVLHGDPESPTSAYNPITPTQIARSGLDYLALGHLHSYSSPRAAGNTVYAWPGCPAGRGFDETGAKGVILGEAEWGRLVRLEFVPLHARRYESIEVPAGDDPIAAVVAATPGNHKQDIYRITFTGTSEPLDLAAIETALKSRFFQVTLRDETTNDVDIWSGMDEDSLRGLFLRQLREEWERATDDTSRQTCEWAVRFGLAALDGKEAPRL